MTGWGSFSGAGWGAGVGGSTSNTFAGAGYRIFWDLSGAARRAPNSRSRSGPASVDPRFSGFSVEARARGIVNLILGETRREPLVRALATHDQLVRTEGRRPLPSVVAAIEKRIREIERS